MYMLAPADSLHNHTAAFTYHRYKCEHGGDCSDHQVKCHQLIPPAFLTTALSKLPICSKTASLSSATASRERPDHTGGLAQC